MSLKWIGISQRLIENTSYVELREALSVEWGEFFYQHLGDFLPLPLSYGVPFYHYVQKLGNALGGVLLSGGNDLSRFNPNVASQRRDAYEEEIITRCLECAIPLFGVCRGAQKIAEYFGSKLEKCDGHTQKHFVFNADFKGFEVNSYHNYCILHLGKDLEKIDCAKDGSVESFKHKRACIYGVMWHIERENGMKYSKLFEEWRNKVRGEDEDFVCAQ